MISEHLFQDSVETYRMGFEPPDSKYMPSRARRSAGDFDANNSGMQEDAPVEVAGGWNWGAFYLNWIWLITHNRVRLSLSLIAICCLPYLIAATPLVAFFVDFFWLAALAQFLISIRLGLKGNEIAWRFRRFESIQDFRSCQKSWARWSLRVFLASSLAIFLLLTWLMGIWH